MSDAKQDRDLGVDALAFHLLADAFLDVTGVLMRIDPDATKDLLRLIQERMVASLDGTTGEGTAAAAALASERAVWKVRAAIRAAEAVLSEKALLQ